MAGPYSPTILEHFKNPRNRGALASPTVSQEGTNPLCGDRVRIELKLDGDIVIDARFTANACAICVASSSMLTELVRGAALEDVGNAQRCPSSSRNSSPRYRRRGWRACDCR